MKREKAIAYYRVSTQRQGASGLGLEAQRMSVESFCKSKGWEIIAERQDVESGRHDDRPGLTEALAKCKAEGAVLVIAKLDRLARKASFVTRLQDERVRFVAVDMPEANEMTVGILAAVAQGEAKANSEQDPRGSGGIEGTRQEARQPREPHTRGDGERKGGQAREGNQGSERQHQARRQLPGSGLLAAADRR